MNEPREPIFFTDRDLGRQFPALLRAAGPSSRKFDAMESTSGFAAKIGAADEPEFVDTGHRRENLAFDAGIRRRRRAPQAQLGS